jgi:excisionase family DNA binding protein
MDIWLDGYDRTQSLQQKAGGRPNCAKFRSVVNRNNIVSRRRPSAQMAGKALSERHGVQTSKGAKRAAKPLLSIAETSEYLGVGRQSLYEMAAQGKLPIVRPRRGKRTMKVVRSILDDLIARGTLGDDLA